MQTSRTPAFADSPRIEVFPLPFEGRKARHTGSRLFEESVLDDCAHSWHTRSNALMVLKTRADVEDTSLTILARKCSDTTQVSALARRVTYNDSVVRVHRLYFKIVRTSPAFVLYPRFSQHQPLAALRFDTR